LKPKFNFFLFADPETILSRKKELNKETIENLNNEYQLLFKNLQSKNNHSTYKAIKNDEMETTLKNILTTIKTCEL
jgi:thymidylate kinase